MPFQMRIPKFPHILHSGVDCHSVLPPPGLPPLPPLPSGGWLVVPVPIGSLIYGKYTSNNVETEGQWNTLFGHDWGVPGAELCVLPGYQLTLSLPLVALGACHKFFLPSYSVKAPAAGGLLALINGEAKVAVAVTTAIGIICIQDCQDVNGKGFFLPTGFNVSAATTHWVGFGWSDLFAGIIALAVDCVAAVLLYKLSNGSRHFGTKYSDLEKAFVGAGIGLLGAIVQGGMSHTPAWLQMSTGVALILIDVTPFPLDHTGPTGVGLTSGSAVDFTGDSGENMHDTFFDNKAINAPDAPPTTNKGDAKHSPVPPDPWDDPPAPKPFNYYEGTGPALGEEDPDLPLYGPPLLEHPDTPSTKEPAKTSPTDDAPYFEIDKQ